MKPLILVSQRLLSNADYPEQREALDSRWGDFLSACGLLPVPVLSGAAAADYFELKLSGVLLTGGNDLSALSPEDPLNALRDRTEEALVRGALERKLPVLGVCRGMQMLAHRFGSTLEDRGQAHVRKDHPLRFEEAGEIGKAYAGQKDANSFHRFCVTGVQAPAKASASAPDGTIEAFEVPEKRVYGLMWHPERYTPFRTADIRFFRSVFAKGAR